MEVGLDAEVSNARVSRRSRYVAPQSTPTHVGCRTPRKRGEAAEWDMSNAGSCYVHAISWTVQEGWHQRADMHMVLSDNGHVQGGPTMPPVAIAPFSQTCHSVMARWKRGLDLARSKLVRRCLFATPYPCPCLCWTISMHMFLLDYIHAHVLLDHIHAQVYARPYPCKCLC